jgi:hypothetical protein
VKKDTTPRLTVIPETVKSGRAVKKNVGQAGQDDERQRQRRAPEDRRPRRPGQCHEHDAVKNKRDEPPELRPAERNDQHDIAKR